MAELFPIRLDNYCRTFHISFFDLKLQCLFCKSYLSVLDLAGFYHKDLCLVWRQRICYACCCPCLRLLAKYERENYCICECSGTTLECLVNKSLQDIIIRCVYCLQKLDYAEKVFCDRNCIRFSLVRGHWRGYCRKCVKSDDW